MQRDLLLLREMIDVAEQAQSLVAGRTVARFPAIPRRSPARLRNRVVHGYWSVDIGVLHTTASEQLGDFVCQLREAEAALTVEADHPPSTDSGSDS